jgi:hypothetical protein
MKEGRGILDRINKIHMISEKNLIEAFFLFAPHILHVPPV